jgi:hypothetical protein
MSFVGSRPFPEQWYHRWTCQGIIDGEPMERAIPADKVASALESLFFTSFAGDVGVGAGISARALDLRRWCITEVDGQVKVDL